MKKIKELLDKQYIRFNSLEFIQHDPVSIPHLFSRKEDIEVAGFLTALISWGNRSSILASAKKLMECMDFLPLNFVLNSSEKELQSISQFYYRTFNSDDLLFVIYALRDIYQNEGGLEKIALTGFLKNGLIKDSIQSIRTEMLKTPHLSRSEKHLANPIKHSAAKRMNMFLRWMIRKDNNSVDFGLWTSIPASELMCPLDVHSGRIARELGLLHRKQNDWTATEELTYSLRKFDNNDPVKYDFALFGLGITSNRKSFKI